MQTSPFMGRTNMSQAEQPLYEPWGEDDDSPPDSERRPSHRPSSIRPEWEPNLDLVHTWAKAVGTEDKLSPVLLVGGPTPSHRATLFRLAGSPSVVNGWIEKGLVDALTRSFSKARCVGSIIPHEWDILWSLLTLKGLQVEEPVRSLIDQGLIFTEVFKGLWEARFCLNEDCEIKDLVGTLSRWVSADELTDADRKRLGKIGIDHELTTAYERLDILFFLAALAKHNDLTDGLIFIVDELDRAVLQSANRKKSLLRELSEFCLSVDRWNRLGAPIGFMVGYSSEHPPFESLSRSNTKLGSRFSSYLTV